MKKNVGIIDRAIRILLAFVFIGLHFANVLTGTLDIVALVLAVILLTTALIRTCPLYLILGINTWNKK
jgi:Protein of unknown function (DUF2892)